MNNREEDDVGTSEFEDAVAVAGPREEAFTADLLEDTLEALRPPRPICVDVSAQLDQVIAGMAERNQGCVLVTRQGVLAGIFTERDLLRRVSGKVDPTRTRIDVVMTPDPEAVAFHDTVAAVLNKMTVGGFRHVPLVDVKRRPVGVLSVKDVVHFFVRNFPRHVLNVAPDPSLHKPDEPGGAG